MVRTDTKIAGVPVTPCDYAFIISATETAVARKKTLLVSPIASQTIALATRNPKLKTVLSRFTHLVPDGFWVKKVLEWKYGISLPKRVYGPSLMLQLLSLARRKKYRIALYGTTAGTLTALENKMSRRYPGIAIVASLPSLFRPLNSAEYDTLVKRLNDARPDLIFIGLGSPFQEEFAVRLMENRNPRLKPVALFTVGAAFDFISGTKKQAPEWMGEHGFEWLYRFMQEPWRLWKRYTLYGILYLYVACKDMLSARKTR